MYTMYPMRTRTWQLAAGQYNRPSHIHLELPLTILTAGFASGTNPSLNRHPGAGCPGRCECAPCATWSQSHLGKKCTSKLGQAQTGQNHRWGRKLHTPVLEIALRTTGDRSLLIGGLKSVIFDFFGRSFKKWRSRFDLDLDLDSRKKNDLY